MALSKVFVAFCALLVVASAITQKELNHMYQEKKDAGVADADNIFANNAKFTEFHLHDDIGPHPDQSTKENSQWILDREAETAKMLEEDRKKWEEEEESHVIPDDDGKHHTDFTKTTTLIDLDNKLNDEEYKKFNEEHEQQDKVVPKNPEEISLLETETETETERLGRYNIRRKCWRFVGRSAKTNHWMEYFECGYDPGYELAPKHDGMLLFMDGRLVTEDCEYKYIKGSEEVQSTSPPYEITPSYKSDGKCLNC